jgi:glycosyltransferase involved in cell wall biosynthesis
VKDGPDLPAREMSSQVPIARFHQEENAVSDLEPLVPEALPRISVIIPAYNAGTYLRQALTSALDQVPPPFEVVVQDGGSTDQTVDILRSYGERLSWESGRDDGQADALNRALARSSGEVVIWLNADDLLAQGALAAAELAFSTDRELAFAYGDFDMIDGDGAVLRRYRSSSYSWSRVFARGCYIFSGSIFVRRDALIAVGGFDASLRACMDLDLLLRLDQAGPSRHLGQTIARFRMHASNKSSTMAATFLREDFRVRRRYAGRSLRLWFVTLRLAAANAFLMPLAPLRYSSWWPRHGGRKTL